jgi:hypothetical protein
MGLVTRFSPSHIAQFWRDWTAMLGYRSADQNGGTARDLVDLPCHSVCWRNSRVDVLSSRILLRPTDLGRSRRF